MDSAAELPRGAARRRPQRDQGRDPRRRPSSSRTGSATLLDALRRPLRGLRPRDPAAGVSGAGGDELGRDRPHQPARRPEHHAHRRRHREGSDQQARRRPRRALRRLPRPGVARQRHHVGPARRCRGDHRHAGRPRTIRGATRCGCARTRRSCARSCRARRARTSSSAWAGSRRPPTRRSWTRSAPGSRSPRSWSQRTVDGLTARSLKIGGQVLADAA